MPETRRLASFSGAYRLWVILAPLMMAIEVAMDLLQPRLIERIIDQGIAKREILCAKPACSCSLSPYRHDCRRALRRVRDPRGPGLRRRSAWHPLPQGADLSFGNLDRLETGGLITRLTNDVTQLTETVAMLLRIMVRAPLLLVGSLILATITSPRLALLFLVLIPAIVITIGIVMRDCLSHLPQGPDGNSTSSTP